jgi:hypothetical protein
MIYSTNIFLPCRDDTHKIDFGMQSSHYTNNYTIENVGVTFDQTRSNQVVQNIDPSYVFSVIRLYWRWESDSSFVSCRATSFPAYGDSNGSTKHFIKMENTCITSAVCFSLSKPKGSKKYIKIVGYTKLI